MIYAPLRRLFKDKTEAAIFFTAFLVEIVFGLYLVYKWGFTFTCGDAVSHLYIPKTVIDNGKQSNFANLGTVWLPMFHILVIPLVLINPLYTTGYAGTIVNALMTGGICLVLYRLIDDKKLGILANILFMGNAFTLFFGATPMMEQTAIFFIVLATYYFKRYWEEDLTEFIKCSLALILGTLTRYEVWGVALVVIFFFIFRELKNGRSYRLAYAHFPLWGIFAWLFYNLAIFRDPLAFIHFYVWGRGLSEPTPFLLVANMTAERVFIISGVLFLVTAFSIIISLIRLKLMQTMLSIILLSPIFFHIFRATLGIGWFGAATARWFYTAFPGLLVPPLIILHNPSLFKINSSIIKKMVTGLAFVTIFTLTFFPNYSRQLNSIVLGVSHATPGALPEWDMKYASKSMTERMKIKNVVGKQVILTTSMLTGAGPTYSAITNTPAYLIIDDYDGPLYIKAMEKPWKICPFVLIRKFSSDNIGLSRINDHYGGKFYIYRYYNDNAWRLEFSQHYELVLETENFLLYHLKAA